MTQIFPFLFRFFLIFGLVFLIDYYAYQAIKTAFFKVDSPQRPLHFYIYWGFHILLYIWVLVGVFTMDRSLGPGRFQEWAMTVAIVTLLPKIILILFLLGEDLFRTISAPFQKPHAHLPERRTFLSQLALGVASLPLAANLYGIFKGKYDFQIHKATFSFPDLPEAFDGFTITQISDLHIGSFEDHSIVEKGINMANSLNSDLMVFTGDMVNHHSEEAEPWIETLGKFTSKTGKFSILGNHDYGDYLVWNSQEEKQQNITNLLQYQRRMGFRPLLNESIKIERNGQFIRLAGVENWGAGGFSKYGDLPKAMEQVEDGAFTVLLSHDPSHFSEQVQHFPMNIHLTLSGHTHGMQYGIEIPGLRWSPVKFRYPTWAGAYGSGSRKIYVNRGFGFIGFRGRVGIWPEITQITLRRG